MFFVTIFLMEPGTASKKSTIQARDSGHENPALQIDVLDIVSNGVDRKPSDVDISRL